MPATAPAHRNDVALVGRLSAVPEQKVLPSGDLLVTFRLVVARPLGPANARGPTVDTVDCVSRRADVRRSAGTWSAGDTISAEGALRRRFWRGPAGATSRTEVEVVRARRVAKV